MVHFWLIERILRDSKKTPNLIVSSSRFAFCTYLFCTQHFFPTFSPSLVPFIMLWGLKLFRNNNHIIVEKNRENATITATTLIWREKYK